MRKVRSIDSIRLADLRSSEIGNKMKLLASAFILWCIVGAVILPSDPPPSLHLTQLSSREFVDLSTVSMIRLPVYLASVPGCPDCQLRYGANIISGGVAWDYSEAAEPAVRKMLSAAVTADERRTYSGVITCNEIARDGCLAEQK